MPVHKKVEGAAAGKLLPFARTKLVKLQKFFGRFFSSTTIVGGIRVHVSSVGNQQYIHLSGGHELVSLIPLVKERTNIQGNVIKGKSKWRKVRSFPISLAGADPVTSLFGYALVRVNESRFLGLMGMDIPGYEVFSDKLRPWFTASEGELIDREAPISHREPAWDGTEANNLFFFILVTPISYVVAAGSFNNIPTPPTGVAGVPLVLTADAALEENVLTRGVRLLATENDILTGGGGAVITDVSTYVYAVTGKKYTLEGPSQIRTFDDVVRLNINTTTDFLSTNVSTITIQNAPSSNPPSALGPVNIVALGNGIALALLPLTDPAGNDYLDLLTIGVSGPIAWVGRVPLVDVNPTDGRIFSLGTMRAMGVGAAIITIGVGPDKLFALRTFDFGATWVWTEVADFSDNLIEILGTAPALIKPWRAAIGGAPEEPAVLSDFNMELGGDLEEYRSLDSGATWSKLRKVVRRADMFGVSHWENPLNIVSGKTNA